MPDKVLKILECLILYPHISIRAVSEKTNLDRTIVSKILYALEDLIVKRSCHSFRSGLWKIMPDGMFKWEVLISKLRKPKKPEDLIKNLNWTKTEINKILYCLEIDFKRYEYSSGTVFST